MRSKTVKPTTIRWTPKAVTAATAAGAEHVTKWQKAKDDHRDGFAVQRRAMLLALRAATAAQFGPKTILGKVTAAKGRK